MRIVGGDWRGTALASPGRGDPGAALRPTADRVRESLFNILAHGRFGDPLADARVLDLFAGTGALALEALSRGAAQATLVENGRPAQRLILDNINRTGAGDRAQLVRDDATRLRPNPGAPFDLIFLDPPTVSTSKAMAERFEVGRDHPQALVLGLLEDVLVVRRD